MSSSGFLLVSMIKHQDQQQLEEERAYFILQIVVHYLEVRAETWREGTDAEAMEECCGWLALCVMLNLLSYTIQDHQPRDSTIHSGLGPPISINNFENVLESCIQTDLMEAYFQLWFPCLR